MLPFGLTTDVSAGALAAGGALGAGAAGTGAATPGAEGDVFARTLKAVAEPGAAGGAAQVAVPAASAEDAIDLLKGAAGKPAVPPAGTDLPGQGGRADSAGAAKTPEVPEGAGEIATQAQDTPSGEEVSETGLANAAPVPAVPALPALAGAGAAVAATGAASPAAPGSGSGVSGSGVSGSGGLMPGDRTSVAPRGAGQGDLTGLPQPAAGGQGAGAGGQAMAGDQAAAPVGRRWQTELPQELRAPVLAASQARNAAPAGPSAPAMTGPGAGTPPPAAQGMADPASALAAAAGNTGTGPVTAVQDISGRAGLAQTGTPQSTVPQAALSQTASAAPSPVDMSQDAALQGPIRTGAGQPVPGAGLPAETAPAGVRAGTGQPAVQAQGEPTAAAGLAARPAAQQGPQSGQGAAAQTQAATGLAAAAVPAQSSVQASAHASIRPQAQTELPATGLPAGDGVPVDSVAEDGALVAKPAGEAGAPATGKPATGASAATGTGPSGPGAAGTGAEARTAATAATNMPAVVDADVPVDDPEISFSRSFEGGAGADFTTASIRGGDLNGAVRTESLQTPNQTQSSHVATQVAAEIARTLKDGQTRFQMRFDPPELGRVDVKMRVGADGSVQAHLIVDRPETLDMFLRDQRGLERALEAAGLTTNSDNLQFSLKQDGGQDFGSNRGDGNDPSALGDDGTDDLADTDQGLTDRVRLMLAEQRGGLDMKV